MKSKYAKEYGVKLYNQGFLKFGPMEQCDTGEWVRWADIAPFLEAAELRIETAMKAETEAKRDLNYALRNSDSWKESCFSARDQKNEVSRKFEFCKLVGIAATVIIILVLMAFADSPIAALQKIGGI